MCQVKPISSSFIATPLSSEPSSNTSNQFRKDQHQIKNDVDLSFKKIKKKKTHKKNTQNKIKIEADGLSRTKPFKIADKCIIFNFGVSYNSSLFDYYRG